MADDKQPFDIDTVMTRVREATADLPKAALFELAEDGFQTPFEQLIACIISIRTRDELTLQVARRLFDKARTATDISTLSEREIDDLLGSTTFHEAKARQIRAIAQQVVDDHDGDLPCDEDLMLSFSGVGPKCANLTLGIACDERRISVDIHVHRVTNRWGYVATTNPERTLAALEEKLPTNYWVEINRLLVPFGKHICTGRNPHCSTCPILSMCRQVGVTSHRYPQ